jgi:hypothetical protein
MYNHLRVQSEVKCCHSLMMETEDVIETLNFTELTRLVALEHYIL